MLDSTTPIEIGQVVAKAQEMKDAGYRLVTMTAIDLGQDIDILYHWDKDLQMLHHRLTVPKDTTVPSISSVLFMALLIENEMRDQFGICFDNLILDFGCKLYLEDAVQSRPFCKISVAKANQ